MIIVWIVCVALQESLYTYQMLPVWISMVMITYEYLWYINHSTWVNIMSGWNCEAVWTGYHVLPNMNLYPGNLLWPFQHWSWARLLYNDQYMATRNSASEISWDASVTALDLLATSRNCSKTLGLEKFQVTLGKNSSFFEQRHLGPQFQACPK